MNASSGSQPWKIKYRPYLLAMAAAFITTMLVAPETIEGDSMEPALSEGQVIILSKEDYSEKRSTPEMGEVVVLDKVHTMEFRLKSDSKNDNAVLRVAGLPGETIASPELLGEYPGPVVLAENQVWLICDNIPEAAAAEDLYGPYLDSRTMGPVDMKQIRGKARLIVWPISDIGRIS